MSSSGTSTPTPVFAHGHYQPSPVFTFSHGGPVAFPPVQQSHMPDSAISMSPQSSQGGWASSDSTEQAGHPVRSPSYCAVSPTTAVRADGVRKKNARFEIPKDRNLQNIDSLIMCSKDDAEKKELKQQKRLLRNRQAALDSRQRKKTHTERLELDKKMWNSEKDQLVNELVATQKALETEREAWMERQQQYEHYIHTLRYEKEEAIRSKTVETTDLRRKNSVLRDHIRDLERQFAMRQHNAESHHPTNDYSNDFSLSNLDIDDETWADDGFEFISQHDENLKMESIDTIVQQSTPRPQPSTTNSSSLFGSADSTKSDVSFWNAFYMCLLFGAFVATTSSSTRTSSTQSTTAPMAPTFDTSITIPALSDDYRAEAGNVLKAVLNSDPKTFSTSFPHHINPPSTTASSSLETLHATLTTPTPSQRLASAYALDADTYRHMTEGDLDADADGEDDYVPRPSRLQSALAEMQREREDSGIERILGRGQGVAAVKVPEKVLRDFREMVRRVGGVVE